MAAIWICILLAALKLAGNVSALSEKETNSLAETAVIKNTTYLRKIPVNISVPINAHGHTRVKNFEQYSANEKGYADTVMDHYPIQDENNISESLNPDHPQNYITEASDSLENYVSKSPNFDQPKNYVTETFSTDSPENYVGIVSPLSEKNKNSSTEMQPSYREKIHIHIYEPIKSKFDGISIKDCIQKYGDKKVDYKIIYHYPKIYDNETESFNSDRPENYVTETSSFDSPETYVGNVSSLSGRNKNSSTKMQPSFPGKFHIHLHSSMISEFRDILIKNCVQNYVKKKNHNYMVYYHFYESESLNPNQPDKYVTELSSSDSPENYASQSHNSDQENRESDTTNSFPLRNHEFKLWYEPSDKYKTSMSTDKTDDVISNQSTLQENVHAVLGYPTDFLLPTTPLARHAANDLITDDGILLARDETVQKQFSLYDKENKSITSVIVSSAEVQSSFLTTTMKTELLVLTASPENLESKYATQANPVTRNHETFKKNAMDETIEYSTEPVGNNDSIDLSTTTTETVHLLQNGFSPKTHERNETKGSFEKFENGDAHLDDLVKTFYTPKNATDENNVTFLQSSLSDEGSIFLHNVSSKIIRLLEKNYQSDPYEKHETNASIGKTGKGADFHETFVTDFTPSEYDPGRKMGLSTTRAEKDEGSINFSYTTLTTIPLLENDFSPKTHGEKKSKDFFEKTKKGAYTSEKPSTVFIPSENVQFSNTSTTYNKNSETETISTQSVELKDSFTTSSTDFQNEQKKESTEPIDSGNFFNKKKSAIPGQAINSSSFEQCQITLYKNCSSGSITRLFQSMKLVVKATINEIRKNAICEYRVTVTLNLKDELTEVLNQIKNGSIYEEITLLENEARCDNDEIDTRGSAPFLSWLALYVTIGVALSGIIFIIIFLVSRKCKKNPSTPEVTIQTQIGLQIDDHHLSPIPRSSLIASSSKDVADKSSHETITSSFITNSQNFPKDDTAFEMADLGTGTMERMSAGRKATIRRRDITPTSSQGHLSALKEKPAPKPEPGIDNPSYIKL